MTTGQSDHRTAQETTVKDDQPAANPGADKVAVPDSLSLGDRAGVEGRRQGTGQLSRLGGRRQAGRRRGEQRGEQEMVPPAEFTSYYGHHIVRPSPWEADIPAYLFAGGVAAGSSLLAAGADLTGRPALRRTGRLGAITALSFSMLALVHDLGRPSRFYNMLRTVKFTSPMSVGTWILSTYGPFAGLAAAAELAGLLPAGIAKGRLAQLLRLLRLLDRPAGVMAAVTAPPVAAYTAVLLSDTSTPSWHAAHRELPFVFCGSAAAASGGLGMIGAPVAQAGPARRLAIGGALVELVAEQVMERSMGVTAEPLHAGHAGRLMRAAKLLTACGALGTLGAARSRPLALLSGAALMAGSACTRFGVFEAGQASARDPRYVVVPQRERLEREGPVRHVDPVAPTDPVASVTSSI